MERVCMARVAEPVFCSTLLPFFSQRSDITPLQGARTAEHDGQDVARESFEEATENITTALGSAFQDTAISEQQPRSQCNDASREEDSRRRCVGPDGNSTDRLHHLEMRVDPLIRSRTVSHQPSCDSLRNIPATTESLQPATSSGISHVASYTEQASELYSDSRPQYGYAAHFTILTEMEETAWPVDDPRHSADVIESLNDLRLRTLDFRVTAALAERAKADRSDLPMFNRQEMIESGVDVQGIRWPADGWSKRHALSERTGIRENELHFADADCLSHYRVSAFDGTPRPIFAHHELRHVLASIDRDVYYTTPNKVMRASLACPSVEQTVLDLTRSPMTSFPIRITCLAATDSDVIVAGGFDGEYALRHIDYHHSISEGYVTHDRNSLVTHVHTFSHRTSDLPQAAFCANNRRLRLLDIETETFTKTFAYDHSLNNAVTSSDGRLRALVGDSVDALVTDAETGETLATLEGHEDYIFSCAWSPNGRLLATGSQDGHTYLWDSRNWSRPFDTVWATVGRHRSLHFTADSSKLIAAEDQDIVSVFDVRRDRPQETKQDICFLGTIAGVTLVNGGDELVVANGDRSVGGLMSFRRTYDETMMRVRPPSMDAVERFRRRAASKKAYRRAGMVDEFVI